MLKREKAKMLNTKVSNANRSNAFSKLVLENKFKAEAWDCGIAQCRTAE